jgi:hypothetical protein
VERWEYLTEFVWANIETKGIKEFLRQRWPDWKNPPKFTPETMIPQLNAWGEQGWELVHMEPVAGVGRNGDVSFTGDVGSWSNVYFCVFKLRSKAV